MNDFKEILKRELDAEKVEYTEKKISDLAEIYRLLCEYNKKINLTAITEPAAAAKKHFADSLLPIKSGLFKNGSSCLDIGTGAGFPGLPLAVFLPECRFTLIDSLAKKLAFTDEAISEIGLKNAETAVTRSEDMIRNSPETRESFDIVVSRAVANLTTLSEYALPFVKIGGYFIALKSKEAKNEITEAECAVKTLGGNIPEIFGNEERNLVIIKKISHSPEKYPRRSGIPEKRPLKTDILK